MASLRPGRSYSKITKKPNTRISIHKPRKSYVKGVPATKIHQFEMGAKGDYPLSMDLVCRNNVQIRSNALEAARITTLKYLTKKLGDTGFFFKVLVYPHHVLRQNSIATGAGADRYSQGMAKSFGKPIGQAARVKIGQNVMRISAPKNSEAVVREALKRASKKLPGTFLIK